MNDKMNDKINTQSLTTIYSEIKQLVDQSNRDFLFQFLEYVKGRVPSEMENEFRIHITNYIDTVSIQTHSKKQSTEMSKQCTYTIKRGLNNGKQCSNFTKDASNLCGKHRHSKLETEIVSVEEPEPRFWDISDVLEKDVQDVQDEELVEDEEEEETVIADEEELVIADEEDESFFSL